MVDSNKIFSIQTKAAFNALALQIFEYQFANNVVYKEFCQHLAKHPSNVCSIEEIPFIPIDFFKSKKILSTQKKVKTIFTSSGTTGANTSKHYVTDLDLYTKSYTQAFRYFYGKEEDFCVVVVFF